MEEKEKSGQTSPAGKEKPAGEKITSKADTPALSKGPPAQKIDTPSETKATISGIKRKSRVSDVTAELISPTKRQRVPTSRFESPYIDEFSPPFKAEKKEKKKEDVQTLYKKNAFLAVRGAESFYLCKTSQNVYSTTKKLRIQWLSLITKPDIYQFDYVDSTEMETVLTEISMDKVNKNNLRLPKSEQTRIEKILDRAIRVEKGLSSVDEVEEEAMEERRDNDSDDDDDDDDDGTDYEDSPSPKKSSKKTPNKEKESSPRKRIQISPNSGGRGKAATPTSRSKKKEKETLKTPKGRGAKAGTKRESEEKKRGADRHLRPNAKIKILEKDPFFEAKDFVPVISPYMTAKMVFRSVHTGDKKALEDLFSMEEGVTKFNEFKTIQDTRDGLQLAGELGRKELFDVLCKEYNSPHEKMKKRKPPPQPIINSMSTGTYNPAFLGIRNIRALNASRGNKEGNQAFLKGSSDSYYNSQCPIRHWMKTGVTVDVMESYLMSNASVTGTTRDGQLPGVVDAINEALKKGHRDLAGKYVTEAERLSGYGFNYLHKEVLKFEKEELRDIILAASVRKKPFSNDAVTPLHCAAINPNIKYIRRLLSIEPDMNIVTRSLARPIHYAAVCEGTGPLEFLLERHASPDEFDSSRDLPIHWAARAGRSKNIEVLVKHAKADPNGIFLDKWGVGHVSRPNRFSMCPLHLAVEAGHLEAVRTLIRYGADVNKAMSAGKDKCTPLMLACGRGYLNIARALVQSGATVEQADKMKRTALTHAVMNGSTPCTSYLLYLGANPDRADSSGNTLVHYAAAYGWYFCLKLLLKDAQAKPDVPNDWQTTPVNIALMKGNTGIVEMLINTKGVDINFKSDTGTTLVHSVCGSRLTEGLDSTLETVIHSYKADPTLRDVNGNNALHHLAANNIKLMGSLWNREVDPEAMKLTVAMAKVLITAGCDPTLRTNEGKTPIMLAIEQVNVDLVSYLVEQGGTVSGDKNRDEKTVLHLMAEQCCVIDLTPMITVLAKEKTKASLENKAAVKENGKVNGDHVAVEVGKEKDSTSAEKPMDTDKALDAEKKPESTVNGGEAVEKDSKSEKPEVKEIPEPGGDADTKADKPAQETEANNEESQLSTLKKMATERDFSGFTPLLRACQVYNTFSPSKEHPLRFSAPKSAIASELEKPKFALRFITALVQLSKSDINATVGPKNMPDEPKEHFAPEGKNSGLHFMISPKCEGDLQAAGLTLMLTFHPDPNQQDMHGKTPLVLAVEAGRQDMVKQLLKAGADPNVRFKVGQAEVSLLLLAAQRASTDIMKLLIDNKADVNCCHSETQDQAIHVMVSNSVREDETIAMIQTLVQAGASINAVNKNGDTPLHIASRENKGHSDAPTSLEEFLLDRGAEVFAKNKQQKMPLHMALNKNGVDPIELCSLLTSFMREQRVDEPSDQGLTPLLFAAHSGATICCMHLITKGANMEKKEYRGNTPINLAVLNSHDSCAIMLMQRKANTLNPLVVSLLEKKDTSASTEDDKKKKKRPVMLWRPRRQWESSQPTETPGLTMTLFEGAVKNDLTGVAHMLMDSQGVPVEAIEAALNLSKFHLALRLLRRIPDASRLHRRNPQGQNLFHILAMKTNRSCPDLQIKVAGALLEKGISLSQQDNWGLTPLMYAALKHQSVPLANFLIQNDKNYNPGVKDKFSRDMMAAFMWDYDWVADKFKLAEVSEWMELLTGPGKATLDSLYDHPLPDPLLLGASVDVMQPDYMSKHGTERTSPLIFAIRNYNFGLAKYMLHKGANSNFADSRGLTPMMHAVQMNDSKMVKLLLNHDYDLESDSVNHAPLKPLLSKEQSRQVLNINFAAPKEQNPDDVADEEVEEDEDDKVSMSKHSEESDDSVDLAEDVEDDADEPMVEVDTMEDSFDKGDDADSDADTDIVEDDIVEDYGPSEKKDKGLQEGATRLSLTRHVSQMANERVFQSISKKSSVDLSVSDSKGWTAAHHAVCSLEHATFDNAEIVYLLAKAGAPLEAKTAAGETVMDLARRTDAPSIVRVLNKLMALEPYNKPQETFDLKPSAFVVKDVMEEKPQPDFRADAEKMLDKLDAASGDGKDKGAGGPRVDSNCEISKLGEVAVSLNDGTPYNITLNKVDVTAGVWGMYNFYKLQIIKHTAKNLFVLFTRWGRIGDRGQFQHTPFQTLKEAAKEFCKIYKSKTGNDWNNLNTTKFINHPKKYRLMSKSEKQHKQHKVEFSLDTTLTTGLSEPVVDLLTEITNVNMFEAAITKHGLDEELMPFGRMKKDTLISARRVLSDLSELIDRASKLRNNLALEKHAEYQGVCEEISQLTNEYYHLVPMAGFENDTIRPISDKMTLRQHTKLLADLMDMQVANSILLGANFNKQETHPLEYVYRSMGCSLEALTEGNPEAQALLTNVNASVPTAKINRMFRVSRKGESERLASLNMPNHQLLWHGSNMANFLSILSRGLLVTPPEVPWQGHLFGEGIYFADTFVKAANYCHNNSKSSGVKVMLLCQVALGNPKIDIKHGDEDHLDDDINSLKILGKMAPQTDFDARMPFGASLSLGQMEQMKYQPEARIQHNEYIVHNAEQVAIRYLVFFNG